VILIKTVITITFSRATFKQLLHFVT